MSVRTHTGVMAIVLLAAAPGYAKNAASDVELWAEFGPELDTNALRINDDDLNLQDEPMAPQAAPLLRSVLGASWTMHGKTQRVLVSYRAGGKLFLDRGDVRASDEFVHQGVLDWAFRLWKDGNGALSGSYYDVYQRQVEGLPVFIRRDFRTGTVRGRLSHRFLAGSLETTIDCGYQGLQYKPQPDNLSFNALLVRTRGTYRFSDESATLVDWALDAGYTGTFRLYAGNALDSDLQAQNERHHDATHIWRLGIRYASTAEFTGYYAFELNNSNSFGEEFGRHVVGMTFVTPVVWDLYLTTAAVFRLSSFADPLLSDSATQRRRFLEEENRSRLSVNVSRAIGQHWSLGLRYNIFINEGTIAEDSSASSGRAPGYLRQTVSLVARFDWTTEQ